MFKNKIEAENMRPDSIVLLYHVCMDWIVRFSPVSDVVAMV